MEMYRTSDTSDIRIVWMTQHDISQYHDRRVGGRRARCVVRNRFQLHVTVSVALDCWKAAADKHDANGAEECVSWPAILGACLARPGPQHLRHYVKEQCEQLVQKKHCDALRGRINYVDTAQLRHGWVPVFLRHGVPCLVCI